MGLFEHWPYVNFHELNTNWLIGKVKNIETAEANTAASAEAAAASAASAQQSAEDSAASASASQQSAAASQQSAEASQQSAEDAAETVSNTLNQINVLQSRVDNIIPQGTQTEGNTELIDVRVGYEGITYSSAGDAVRGQNIHQDEITKYSLEKLIDFTSSDTAASNVTPVFMKAGDTVAIDVKEKTVSTSPTAFISGHSGVSVSLVRPQRFFFTAQHSGYLSIYNSNYESGYVKANIWLVNSVNNIKANNDMILDTLYTRKNIINLMENGGLNSASGQPFDQSTSIRSASYLDEHIDRIEFNTEGYSLRVYAYDAAGSYIGAWNNHGFTDISSQIAYIRYSPFDLNVLKEYSDNYFYKIVITKDSGTITPEETALYAYFNNIENDKQEEVYYVGSGYDFDNITEMLTALEGDTTEKTVYIMPGTYDIFNEIGGAAYMATVNTSQNWRAVNKIVPPNTKLIGIGNVVLEWLPSDTDIIDNDHAFLFSPLNVSASCEIKNITIRCKNCRYGIHDETSGVAAYNGAIHKYENVNVTCLQSTYGATYAYGSGHNKNMELTFINCVFESYYSVPWSSHDWPAAVNEISRFYFQNCIFNNLSTNTPGRVRFSSTDLNGRLDNVLMSACSLRSVVFGTESNVDVRQGYDATLICCPDVDAEYSEHIPIAYRMPLKKINTIN